MKEIERRELELRQRQLETKLTGETIKTPEIWRPDFGIITISGPSGTGKTTTALELIIRYNIPTKRFIKVGASMRDDLGDTGGFLDRPLSKDIEVDEMQALFIRQATKDDPGLLEGRLAGIIKAEEMEKAREKGVILPVISFLFYCEFNQRMIRNHQKWNYDHPMEQRTLQEQTIKEKEREIKDLETWKKAHPEWNITNPFNPGLKDKDGVKVYNKSFSTTGKSVEQVVEEIHRYLRNEGLVKRVA